jgi:cytochrome c biogenesis protein
MHTGILLIIAGMFMGQFTGFSGTAKLTAGQTYVESNAGFEIKLDSFEIVYDENYNITDYISTVTVIDDGEEVLTREITVNSPLEYKGVKFYQWTYGWAAKVKITETESGEVLLDSVINLAVSASGVGLVDYSMYDSGSGINVTQRFIVIPDQASKGAVNNLSPLPNNPALFFILYYDSEIVIIEDVALGESEDIGGLTVAFEGLGYYTGLEVNCKPELPVVFIGSVIFIV